MSAQRMQCTEPQVVFPVDLNSLIDPKSGWTLTNATAIRDTNWILGIGSFDPDGTGPQQAYSRLFILQVSEPASVILWAIGMALFATSFTMRSAV